MIAMRHGRATQAGAADRAIWLAAALAGLAALSYVLIGLGILGVGDLAASERPAGIVFAAAGGYLLGGLLILARRRWLWIVGAAINALVILVFLLGYQDRPAVLFSAGGLASKAAEILLEAVLLSLILTGVHRARRPV
ncbi:MAG: hypothetical protein QJR03_12200 [Sphaerobacter sp.]|nr:hypothetical protein [Sphaerobacter sp.]